MFDRWDADDQDQGDDDQIEAWDGELFTIESEISRLRARQIELLRNLDRCQIDTAEGARTMAEWVSCRLDVSHHTSSRLMQIARAAQPDIHAGLATGRWTVDRAALLVRLRQAGASSELWAEAAEKYSLGQLWGLIDQLRHMTPDDERELFDYRYLVAQPNLDESALKLWGHLPGCDGQTVLNALTQRADQLPVLPGEGQGQKMADALTTICLDSLTQGPEEPTYHRAVTVADIFVDANLAAPTFGEAGARVSAGPKVGPNTLSEILCTGKVRMIVTDGTRPVSYSDLGETIPPAIRAFISWRDQGQCSIEGCRSRYRLQPHHLRERQHGGTHDPENLVSVCWYHHHVAIHQHGMTIDPDSTTHRRRLIGPRATARPP